MLMRYPTQYTLIISSVKTAYDLLERKSNIYSDRPVSVMYSLLTWDFNIGVIPYSSRWRDHRRTFHQYFHPGVVSRYFPVQLSEARTFLRRSLDSSPETLSQSVRLIPTAVVMRTVYDMQITDMDDDYVRVAQEALVGFGVAGIPGAFWIEYFPFLKGLPEWVPGANFKKFANRIRPYVEEMKNRPFEEVRKRLTNGVDVNCMVASLLRSLPEDSTGPNYAEKEEVAINAAGVAQPYAGAVDSTTSLGQSFLIAMAMFPDTQAKVQEELDRVVDPDRLPDFGDHDSLVSIRACVLESIRWMPVAPLGAPHRVTEDDEYKGYFIPKGTLVFVVSSPHHLPTDRRIMF